MYKKVFLFFFLGILTTYYILHNTGFVFAQSANPFNFTLSPSLLDITARPGDTIKEKFRVRNNSSEATTLVFSVDKLDPHSRNGEIVPVAATSADTSTSWISFDDPHPTANPGQWVDVPFTITVPKSAAFGYYYALRIGSSNAVSGQNVATTKLVAQIVLPVLLTVESQDAHASLQLLSFNSTSIFNEYLPVTFQVSLRNAGNIHVRPAGNIFIKTGDSTTVLPFNPDASVVIPGQTRTIATPWSDGFFVQVPQMEDGKILLDKNNKPQMHLQINWDRLTHFRFGKYTATALVVYDNGSRDVPLEATTTFWVIPWKILGGLLGIIVVFGTLFKLWLNWYIKRQLTKHNA